MLIEAYKVACPRCRAGQGLPCVSVSKTAAGLVSGYVHPARARLARETFTPIICKICTVAKRNAPWRCRKCQRNCCEHRCRYKKDDGTATCGGCLL